MFRLSYQNHYLCSAMYGNQVSNSSPATSIITSNTNTNINYSCVLRSVFENGRPKFGPKRMRTRPCARSTHEELMLVLMLLVMWKHLMVVQDDNTSNLCNLPSEVCTYNRSLKIYYLPSHSLIFHITTSLIGLVNKPIL